MRTLPAGSAPVVVEAWDHRIDDAEELVQALDEHGIPHRLDVISEERFFATLEGSRRSPLPFRAAERRRLRGALAWIYLPGPSDLPRWFALRNSTRHRAFRGDLAWWAAARRQGLPACRWLGGYVSEPRARTWGYSFDAWEGALERAESWGPHLLGHEVTFLRSVFRAPGTLWVRAEGAPADAWFRARWDPRSQSPRWNVADLSLPASERPIVADFPGGALELPLDPEGSEGCWGPVLPFSLWPPYAPGPWIEGTTWTLQGGRVAVQGRGAEDPRVRALVTGPAGSRASPLRLDLGLNPAWSLGWSFDRFARGVATLHLGPTDDADRAALRLGLPLRLQDCRFARADPRRETRAVGPPADAVDLTARPPQTALVRDGTVVRSPL